MFSLDDIQLGAVAAPRKVIIYGPAKVGKSTLAGSTQNALLIPTEDRVAQIDCPKAPVIKKYENLMEIFNFLLEKKHPYKRIIIDSLDWLEPIIHKYICEQKGFKSLTDDHNKETAFSKGLKFHAVEGMKNFLYNCDVLRNDAGLDIIIVAHDNVITVNPPESDSYDKHVMKIDKNALAVVEEWADIIAYYSKDVFVRKDDSGIKDKGKAISAQTRTLHLAGENPAMINGNSFGVGDVNVLLEHCPDIMEWLLSENKNKEKTKVKKEKK
jgi:hypothetical protein